MFSANSTNQSCFISCTAEVIASGKCSCNNRIMSSVWKPIIHYIRENRISKIKKLLNVIT